MSITPCRSVGVGADLGQQEGSEPTPGVNSSPPLPQHPSGEEEAKKWMALVAAVKVDPSKRKWSEALTLRESTSTAMVRKVG